MRIEFILLSMPFILPAQALAQSKTQSQAQSQTQTSAQIPAQADADAIRQVVVNGKPHDLDAGRDAVAGMVVVGRQRIAESGVQSVGELLRREPAISVGKDGRLGLLGLPGYTQVLVDGLPPQGDAFSLDLVHVDRIEIMKSTTAATGPVGIAGTINIVRRKAERKAFTQLAAGLSRNGTGLGESVSWTDNEVAAGNALAYNLALSASRKPSASSSRLLETRQDATQAPATIFEGNAWASSVLSILTARGDFTWTPAAGDKVSLRPDASRIRHDEVDDETRAWRDGRTLAVGRANDNTLDGWSLPLRWERQLASDGTLALQLSMNRSRMAIAAPRLETASDAAPRRYRNDQERHAANAFLDLDVNTELDGGHAISAGARLVRNDDDIGYTDLVDGAPDAGLAALGRASTARRRSGRLFVQDEWRIGGGVALNAGVSAERRTYAIDEGPARSRAAYTMWSPSLHLSKKIGGDRKRQLRLSLARSFQPPGLDQMLLHPTINPFAPCPPAGARCGANGIDTADSAGNPGLRPERALGLNLSITQGIGAASEVVVEGYAREIAHKIGWEYALENVAWADVPRYLVRPANLGRATVRGVNVEGRLDGKDVAAAWSGFELHGSVGVARSVLEDVPGPDNRIAGVSPWRAKLGGGYALRAAPVKVGFEAAVLPADWIRTSRDERTFESGKVTLGLNASWKPDAKTRVSANLDNLLRRTGLRIERYDGTAPLDLAIRRTEPVRFSVKVDTSL